MKNKIIITVGDNITAADVSDIKKIIPISFNGNLSMKISDLNSIDKAIGLIRDPYNVDEFEDDTDVIIIYDRLPSDIINHFAASFTGCDKIGVIPFINILPVIVRNKKCELPVSVQFDGRSYPLGGKNDPIVIELTDFLFLFYVNDDFFDNTSSEKINEISQQLHEAEKEREIYLNQVTVLASRLEKIEQESNNKTCEIQRLKEEQITLQTQLNEYINKEKKLNERFLICVNIPEEIWNIKNDWTYSKCSVYLHKPKLSGMVKDNELISSLTLDFGFTIVPIDLIGFFSNDYKSKKINKEDRFQYEKYQLAHFLNSREPGLGEKIYEYTENFHSELYDRVSKLLVDDDGEIYRVNISNYEIRANKSGKLFRLIKENDEITEQNQAIAVLGNENDRREDIDRWLSEIGRYDLKCI